MALCSKWHLGDFHRVMYLPCPADASPRAWISSICREHRSVGFQMRGRCNRLVGSVCSGRGAFPYMLNLLIRPDQLPHSRGVIMSGRINDFPLRARIFARPRCPRREFRSRRRRMRIFPRTIIDRARGPSWLRIVGPGLRSGDGRNSRGPGMLYFPAIGPVWPDRLSVGQRISCS